MDGEPHDQLYIHLGDDSPFRAARSRAHAVHAARPNVEEATRCIGQRTGSPAAECAAHAAVHGKLVGEGFDYPPLDTLVLAMPILWKGTLQQYADRLHREHADKTLVRIIDVVDAGHPALLRMWVKRQRGYQAMGYRVAAHAVSDNLDFDAALPGEAPQHSPQADSK